MTTTTNMHDITQAVAKSRDGAEWLELKDKDGNVVVLFVPHHLAQAFADAFDMHQRSAEAVRRIEARQMEGADQ